MTVVFIALFFASASALLAGAPARQAVARHAEQNEPMDLGLDEMFGMFEAAEEDDKPEPVSTGTTLESMEGATAPLGVFDPLGLSKYGSAATLYWYRAAEVKHGRVAMAATLGWIVNELGVVFGGDVANGVSFKSLGKGLDAWTNLPNAGKLQIIAFVGFLEWCSETSEVHPMRGGPSVVPLPLGMKLWDPFGFSGGLTNEERKVKRIVELNNGRLAMIAVAGFFSASLVPGSVPLLPATW